jgi:hypothetical protein
MFYCLTISLVLYLPRYLWNFGDEALPNNRSTLDMGIYALYSYEEEGSYTVR